MKMRRIVWGVSLLLLLLPSIGLADRGSIPFLPWVHIYEPTQRAAISWNGREQILLLSTDLYASEPVKILQVLPLPAEPEVSEGDMEVFTRINEWIRGQIMDGFEGRGRSGDGVSTGPAGEVTFHEQIGSHDITVARVLRGEEFVAWANEYLTSHGVDQPTIPIELQLVIEEYIADGFDWFVFDVVELSEEPLTNTAISYRFATEELFFPMRITRTESGFTQVYISAIVPPGVLDFSEMRVDDMDEVYAPLFMKSDALERIDPSMAELMSPKDLYVLHSWLIEGELPSFDYDVRVGLRDPKPLSLYRYQDRIFYGCAPDPEYPYASKFGEEDMRGTVERIVISEEPRVTALSVDNFVLLDGSTGLPLTKARSLEEQTLIVRGYRAAADLEMWEFLDLAQFGIFATLEGYDRVMHLPEAFYVTEILGWEVVCGRELFSTSAIWYQDQCFWAPIGDGMTMEDLLP